MNMTKIPDDALKTVAKMLSRFADVPELAPNDKEVFLNVLNRCTDTIHRYAQKWSAGIIIEAHREDVTLEFTSFAGDAAVQATLLNVDSLESEHTEDPTRIFKELPGLVQRATKIQVRGGNAYCGVWRDVLASRNGARILRPKICPILNDDLAAQVSLD